MKVNSLLRLFLCMLVFVVGCIIFAVVDGESEYVQAPMDLLRTGIEQFGASTLDDLSDIDLDSLTPANVSETPVMRCKCKVKGVRGASNTAKELDKLLPWLNVTTRQELSKHHPNLPVELLYNASVGRACHQLPTPFSIEWRNRHWQEVSIDKEGNKILLYSATYDPNPDAGAPCVRVLGVSRVKLPRRAWCQLWYNAHQPPTVTRVSQIDHLDYQGKNTNRQMPYLLTCPLPTPPDPANTLPTPPHPANTLPTPSAISIVASPCTSATNLLKVNGAKEREASAYVNGKIPENPHSVKTGWRAAVCGPALYYYDQDFSLRLVEWMEVMRAIGMGRVFLYSSHVHPNIAKVLRYYENNGFLEVTDYAYPPPYINEPSIKRLWTLTERQKMFAQENVYFTDCLLRHMHQYRFIAHFDPDEVPILPAYENFTHFLNDVLNQTTVWKSGYKLQWNFFYNDLTPGQDVTQGLPEHLWVMRHTRRLAKNLSPSPGKFKSIYDMDLVRGVFSHGVLRCATGPCSHVYMQHIPPAAGYVGHYSRTCGRECNGEKMKDEFWLHKFRKEVARRVQGVLRELDLL